MNTIHQTFVSLLYYSMIFFFFLGGRCWVGVRDENEVSLSLYIYRTSAKEGRGMLLERQLKKKEIVTYNPLTLVKIYMRQVKEEGFPSDRPHTLTGRTAHQTLSSAEPWRTLDGPPPTDMSTNIVHIERENNSSMYPALQSQKKNLNPHSVAPTKTLESKIWTFYLKLMIQEILQ